MKDCEICKTPYKPRIKSSKYCSIFCYGKSKKGEVRTKTGIYIPCKICDKLVYRTSFFVDIEPRKYCSRNCYYKSREGVRVSPKTEFKKGVVSKRKNKSFPEILGEKHYAWKGEHVGYGSLHDWIRKHLGTPDTCEHCHKTGLIGKKIHWANKDHQYRRDLTDWIRLCCSCHKIYDSNLKCGIPKF